MQISEEGLNLIKRYESFAAEPYLDAASYPTIGWGHKIDVHKEKFIDPLNREDAEKLLQNDLKEVTADITRYVGVSLSQGQFDALCSLIFNWGIGNFIKSIGFKFLNQKKYNCAASEFFDSTRGVIRVNGKVYEGLVKRRQAELKLWNNGLKQ